MHIAHVYRVLRVLDFSVELYFAFPLHSFASVSSSKCLFKFMQKIRVVGVWNVFHLCMYSYMRIYACICALYIQKTIHILYLSLQMHIKI